MTTAEKMIRDEFPAYGTAARFADRFMRYQRMGSLCVAAYKWTKGDDARCYEATYKYPDGSTVVCNYDTDKVSAR